MSRKSKLILATAVFGAALFAASCGGGGGTTAGTGNGSTGNGSNGGGGGGGTQPPPASVEAKVLALLEVNGSKRVSICELKNDTKGECGNDISSGANVTLTYIHEFREGNVVLRDSNNKLYFFDGNQVKKLTTYRQLGSTDEITTSAGIDALTGTNVKWYATENFVIMHDSSSNNLVAVSKEGKVIKDNLGSSGDVKAACEAVTKSGTTYKLNADGTSSTTTIPTDLKASAGGRHVVKVQDVANYKVYLTSDKCSTDGAVNVATLSSDPNDAQMVLAGDGNFYIALRNGTSLNYYKVSGNTPSNLTTSSIPALRTSNPKYSYALDGEGRLYAINGSANDEVIVYYNNGTRINNATVYGANSSGYLLGFANRVLARNGTVVYEIYYNGTHVTNSTINTITQAPITGCTDATNTKRIDGEGTNFIRCAFDDNTNRVLYSLRYSGGSYLVASKSFSSAINDAEFVAGKALVDSGGVQLCTTTDTPSISCNDTGAPNFDTTLLRDGDNNKYLKSDGKNKVLYTSGGAVKAGDIFGPPADVLIPATGISGGSASFDLTKFAYIAGSGSCPTSIAYLFSPTALPKAYTIEQPSGACVKGILKVFP